MWGESGLPFDPQACDNGRKRYTGVMKFRPFSLSCQCGLVPARIKQVGMSAGHQLVIHWWCLHCRKAIYVVKDLRQYVEESAGAEDLDGCAQISTEASAPGGDARFLESMGIRFLADSES